LPGSRSRLPGLVAITYQFGDRDGEPGFSATNFFSFFTIQSNVIAIATLAVTAVVAQGETHAPPRGGARRRRPLHGDDRRG
jgi:hypothetical protein